MLAIDVCLPAAADAMSLAHMDKLFKHEYGIYGHSLEESKRASAAKDEFISSLNVSIEELEGTFNLLKKGDIPAELLTEAFENHLEYMSVKAAGLVGYISSLKKSAQGNVMVVAIINQVIPKLIKTHSLITDMKIYVMEARADLESPNTDNFSSLEDMFASLDS